MLNLVETPPPTDPSELPTYEKPPLRETVISVMFEPIAGLTSAHVGRFWATEEASREFDAASDLAPVEPVVEVFDARPPEFLRRMARMPRRSAMPRVQLRGTSGTRLLQIQADRLIFNWIRPERADAYPRFATLHQSFERWLTRFTDFLETMRIPVPRVIQWELVYVNVIPRGPLWEHASDLPGLLPGLTGGIQPPIAGAAEVWEGRHWRFERRNPDARLLVELERVFGFEEAHPQELQLRWTARGPADDWESLRIGLESGHEMIVQGFRNAASDRANAAWGLVDAEK